jgi:hypothetical protein
VSFPYNIFDKCIIRDNNFPVRKIGKTEEHWFFFEKRIIFQNMQDSIFYASSLADETAFSDATLKK